MRSQTLLLTLFFCLSLTFAQSQGVGISPTTASPDPSAGLDVNFTNKGFLLPRMTQTQRGQISNPAVGLQIYNTTTNCINLWTGSFWKKSCFDCDFDVIATNNSPICAGGTLNISTPAIQGASYSWTGPNGFSSSIQNPVLANVSTLANGVYTLQVTVNGCTSSSATTIAAVSVGANPPGMITGPSVACTSTGGHIYSIAPVSDVAYYFWTVPSGSTITSGQGTDSITVTFGGIADVITVTDSNFCGVNPQSSNTPSITVLPSPAQSISYSPSPALLNSPVYFSSAPPNSGNTYNWTFNSGSPANSNSQYPSSMWSSPGAYAINLLASNSGCSTNTNAEITVVSSLPAHGSQTFGFSNTPQTFVVPSGITSVTLDVYGAQGGSYFGNGISNIGGLGGESQAAFAVTPGAVLYIYVGNQPTDNTGGFNGGGNGCTVGTTSDYGTGGGGASDVRLSADLSLNGRIIVGGGGGGVTGYNRTSTGGDGGGLNGSDGTGSNPVLDGYGGTQSSGGSGDIWYHSSGPGSFGQGGDAGCVNQNGGGGGGGWYGGGGGEAGSAGGGSGYVSPTGSSNVTMNTGVNSGNGKVVITW